MPAVEPAYGIVQSRCAAEPIPASASRAESSPRTLPCFLDVGTLQGPTVLSTRAPRSRNGWRLQDVPATTSLEGQGAPPRCSIALLAGTSLDRHRHVCQSSSFNRSLCRREGWARRALTSASRYYSHTRALLPSVSCRGNTTHTLLWELFLSGANTGARIVPPRRCAITCGAIIAQ